VSSKGSQYYTSDDIGIQSNSDFELPVVVMSIHQRKISIEDKAVGAKMT
jgi:hypothetical protein